MPRLDMKLQAQALLGDAAGEPAAHPGAAPAADTHCKPAQPHQVGTLMSTCFATLLTRANHWRQ